MFLSNNSPCNSYFQEFKFVCITIIVKLIKHLYNSHLRKLPIAHGEVSVMYINSEKLTLPGRCAPVEFFRWKCEKLRKKIAKGCYPALIRPFRTSLFSALSGNKISHMKLQSLKMFKTTKDWFTNNLIFFFFFFFFFANWHGRLWGFVNLVL